MKTEDYWRLLCDSRATASQKGKRARERERPAEEGGTIITSLWLFEVASGLFPRYSKYRLSACLATQRPHSWRHCRPNRGQLDLLVTLPFSRNVV